MYPRRATVPPKRLCELLLWGPLVHREPAVVLGTDGTWMACVQYRGRDLAMLDEDQAAAYLHRLHHCVQRFGTGWCLLPDQWTEPTTAYLESTWHEPTAAFLDAARRAQFAGARSHASDYYLTLCWQPQDLRRATWYEGIFQQRQAGPLADDPGSQLGVFLHAVEAFVDALQGVMPTAHLLDSDALCTYLHRCVSWSRYPVATPELPLHLAAQLTDQGYVHAYTPRLGEQYLRPLTIKSWPRQLGALVPRALAALPFPYRFSVRWLALDPQDARALIESTLQKWETAPAKIRQMITALWQDMEQDDRTQQHLSSLKRALHALNSGECGFGYVTPTVTVWGESPGELLLRERQAVTAMQQFGCVVAAETVNATAAWAASLPGHVYPGARDVPAPSLALAFLMPHAAVDNGPDRDAHYDDHPLFLASSDGHPYRVALHPGGSESGNMMIAGPTRSGKTGLVSFMTSQFHRYPHPQVFCFDKDYGLYAGTVLGGGVHYDLGGEQALGFQPLAAIDDASEKRWAHGWLLRLIESQGETLSPHDREECWKALGRLADYFPRPLRTVSAFVECVQVPRLKPVFRPFMQGGPYAFLDADHDDLAFARWTTIEMRKLLDMPEALPHVLRVIFHRMSARFTGQPTLVVLIEARKLLADPVFGPEILDYLKERAKVNVSVILEVQEIVDFSTSPSAQAIYASCKTFIFLPNDAATHPAVQPLYEACGLAPMHCQLLAMSTPKQDYLYKSDQGVRRYQLHLSPLERLLCAASTPEEIRAFRALVAAEPTEPLPAAWLRQHGFADEADIFCAHYAKGHDNDDAPAPWLSTLRAAAPRLYATNGAHAARA